MAAEGQQAEGIVSHLDDIADLLQCDGIALAYHGRLTAKGLTPSESELAELAAFLTARNIDSVVAYHDIGAEFPAGRDFVDRAAGMLVVPLSRPSGDYLIFFRQEVVRNVNWAGDPEKPVQLGAQGARLTPRKSFELWKETVRGQSIPWRPVELRIAESLRVSLLEVVLRLSDVTASERLKAQERQDLLIAELNHRVRNILSLIRGVVNQSKDSATTIDAFTNVVGGRIHALARAHDQITSDNWQPASFRNLVMTEADAYLGDSGDRLQIDGPDVLLEPRAFTTVALVIHEMMTNAVKYGALSDRRGRIEITTALDPRGHFSVAWDERGGPSVERPTRRGFGSEVIERSITHDLTGEAEIAFPATGLQARFTIPGRFFHAADGDSSDRPPPAPDEPPSKSVPDDVLLVEDSFVIALDTEEMLRGLGISSVRTANGVLQAMQEISRKTPEFALLDVNLGNETSIPVAERLIELDVRFAFASGLGEEATLPASLRHVTIIAKPYSRQSVQSALRGG